MVQEELDFLQIVSVVTSQIGCTMESVDGKTIAINCPGGKDQELKCAKAIETIIEEKRHLHEEIALLSM